MILATADVALTERLARGEEAIFHGVWAIRYHHVLPSATAKRRDPPDR